MAAAAAVRGGASATCWCGRASLKFEHREPRAALECCCHDCTQKVAWSRRAQASEGGHRTPAVARLVYLENRLSCTVVGGELLEHRRLRDGAGSSFVAAMCCGAVLAVDNAFYFGNVVAVLQEACVLDCGPCRAAGRSHVADYESRAEARPELARFDGPPSRVFFGDARDDASEKACYYAELGFSRPPRSDETGRPRTLTLQGLLRQLGIADAHSLGLLEAAPI